MNCFTEVNTHITCHPYIAVDLYPPSKQKIPAFPSVESSVSSVHYFRVTAAPCHCATSQSSGSWLFRYLTEEHAVPLHWWARPWGQNVAGTQYTFDRLGWQILGDNPHKNTRLDTKGKFFWGFMVWGTLG